MKLIDLAGALLVGFVLAVITNRVLAYALGEPLGVHFSLIWMLAFFLDPINVALTFLFAWAVYSQRLRVRRWMGLI